MINFILTSMASFSEYLIAGFINSSFVEVDKITFMLSIKIKLFILNITSA